MKSEILFLTQASKKIGLGKLKECLAVAEVLDNSDIEFYLIDTDTKVLPLIKFKFKIFDSLEDIKVNKVFDICVMKFRDNNIEKQKIAKSLAKKLVIIDELGGIEVISDVLVNSSINRSWHQYIVSSDCRFFIGRKYFILDKKFIRLRSETSKRKRGGKKIMVSMGGADRSGATIKICQVLKKLKDFQKLIILGPLFSVEKELKEIIKDDKTFIIKKNPENFIKLLTKQDLLISAGGNTLWEAIFLKIPTIILYEDGHEKEQGLEFEKLGFAKVVGQGIKFNQNNLIDSITNINKLFFPTGNVIDGKGIYRIKKIIEKLI